MFKYQKGYTLIGVIFWGALLGFFIYFTAKVIPVYLENQEVKQALQSLKQIEEIKSMGKPSIQERLLRIFQVNSIKIVSHKELEVEKKGDEVKLYIDYEARTHLFYNIDVVMKFHDEVIVGK